MRYIGKNYKVIMGDTYLVFIMGQARLKHFTKSISFVRFLGGTKEAIPHVYLVLTSFVKCFCRHTSPPVGYLVLDLSETLAEVRHSQGPIAGG